MPRWVDEAEYEINGSGPNTIDAPYSNNGSKDKQASDSLATLMIHSVHTVIRQGGTLRSAKCFILDGDAGSLQVCRGWNCLQPRHGKQKI